MRLDKYLASCGFGSRKEVKKYFKGQRILVNGQVVKDGKMQIREFTDEILVDGEETSYQEFFYYMLHKPQNVLSATEDRQQKTVLDLLAPADYRPDLFPVGRLDKDTEGLLILTNDGQLAHELLSPKKHVEKEYLLHVTGEIAADAIAQIATGIFLKSGEQCQPAQLLLVEQNAQTSIWRICIKEGKYHQVKRMIAAVGGRVTYLKRLRMGNLELDPRLPIGSYRKLTETEMTSLKESVS